MLDTALINILNCPQCKGDLFVREKGVKCRHCSNEYLLINNTVDFRKSKEIKEKLTLQKLYKCLKIYMNPLCCPFSPLVMFANHRLKKYYLDTLFNRDRARNFFAHYLQKTGLKPSDTVFDFGCGRGRIAAILSLLGFVVIGCDIYHDDYRNKIDNTLFYLTDKDKVGIYLKPNTCKLAVDILVVNYIVPEFLQEYFSSVYQILEKNGFFLLVSGNPSSYGIHAFNAYYPYRYHRNFIVEALSKERFDIIDGGFEGFYAPIFPRFFNWCRKMLAPNFEIFDYDSKLTSFVKPEKRGFFWILAKAR